MMVCGLLKVRASTHWLGMGQSVHKYFLMASYLSFRELDKIQTTFEEKRIFVRSCVLRVVQHLEFFRKSCSCSRETFRCSEWKKELQGVSLYFRTKGSYSGYPWSVLGLYRRMSKGILRSPELHFWEQTPLNTNYREKQDLKLWIQIHTMFVSGVTLCCKTLK